MYGREIAKILVSKEDIKARVKELAEKINRDYAGEPLLVVCILRGATIFFADLFRELTGDVEVDFIAVSSYGSGASSSGEVKLLKDFSAPVAGKHLLIVEDIIDTGTTLVYLKKLLEARRPASIKLCALLDKPSRRKVELEGDYIGFEIPNEYVVGYGLDFNEKFRNLPDVCVLAPEVYGG